MNFEITAVGYDGNTDETDDRVIWLSAPSREYLDQALAGVPFQMIYDLPVLWECLDYDLPGDVEVLKERLQEFAK